MWYKNVLFLKDANYSEFFKTISRPNGLVLQECSALVCSSCVSQMLCALWGNLASFFVDFIGQWPLASRSFLIDESCYSLVLC